MATGTIPFLSGVHATLTNADDLNNIYGVDKQGLYYLAGGVANSPADWSWMLVCGGNGTCQIVFTESGVIYTRAYTGSPLSWRPWYAINNNQQAFSLSAVDTNITDFGHNSHRYGNVVYCQGFFKTSAQIDAQANLISFDSSWNNKFYRSEGWMIARNSNTASPSSLVFPIYMAENNHIIQLNKQMPAQSDWVFFHIILLMK